MDSSVIHRIHYIFLYISFPRRSLTVAPYCRWSISVLAKCVSYQLHIAKISLFLMQKKKFFLIFDGVRHCFRNAGPEANNAVQYDPHRLQSSKVAPFSFPSLIAISNYRRWHVDRPPISLSETSVLLHPVTQAYSAGRIQNHTRASVSLDQKALQPFRSTHLYFLFL